MNSSTNISRFSVIPVMDLMGGRVVRAQCGNRDNYQPVVSRLGCSSEPVAVAQALLKLYPFTTLYIADLDALRGNGSHLSTVKKLRAHFPQLQLWLDAGITSEQDWAPWAELQIDCVVGTESQRDMASAIRFLETLDRRAILSLDYHLLNRKGLSTIFEQPQYWPQRLIAMTLDRVGSGAGPDWEQLEQLRGQFDGTLFAAGGVRNADDLVRLKQMGVGGALVASALHDGNLSGQDLLPL